MSLEGLGRVREESWTSKRPRAWRPGGIPPRGRPRGGRPGLSLSRRAARTKLVSSGLADSPRTARSSARLHGRSMSASIAATVSPAPPAGGRRSRRITGRARSGMCSRARRDGSPECGKSSWIEAIIAAVSWPCRARKPHSSPPVRGRGPRPRPGPVVEPPHLRAIRRVVQHPGHQHRDLRTPAASPGRPRAGDPGDLSAPASRKASRVTVPTSPLSTSSTRMCEMRSSRHASMRPCVSGDERGVARGDRSVVGRRPVAGQAGQPDPLRAGRLGQGLAEVGQHLGVLQGRPGQPVGVTSSSQDVDRLQHPGGDQPLDGQLHRVDRRGAAGAAAPRPSPARRCRTTS